MYVHTTVTSLPVYRASRSAGGESLGSSQVFPGHVNSLPHAGDLGIPRNVSELVKAFYRHLIP